MKRIIGACVLTTLVGACSGSGNGEAGAKEDGIPMTARMTVVAENGAHTITMTSRSGYTCTAIFDQRTYMASKQASQELPVTCDNGDRGTAIYTNANFRQQAFTAGQTQITYQLESGQKGSISL